MSDQASSRSQNRKRSFRDLASAVQDAGERKVGGIEMLAGILDRLSIIVRLEASSDEVDNWLIYALAEIMHELPKGIAYLAEAKDSASYTPGFLDTLAYWEKWLEERHP